MAVVHLGRLRGDAGFVRAVAIKRLHRQYVGDPELSALLLDEARLASRLKHPNVVAPQDLVTHDGEIFIVMEYVHGLNLAVLLRDARVRGERIPIPIVVRLVSDVLSGLHAAHEAVDGRGRPLALVHRDISPQNIMVGADGLTRVLDFGIAQAAFRSQTTREGHLRAKLAYAAPEHVLDRAVDRRTDVYSTAIVCWESLTLERLFSAGNDSALLARVLEGTVQPGSRWRPEISPELDALLFSALSKDPADRPSSAEEFALALESIAPPATHREVARWVAALGGEALERLSVRVLEAESGIIAEETFVAFAAATETHTHEAPAASTPMGLRQPGAMSARAWKAAATVLAMTLAGAIVSMTALSNRRWRPDPEPTVAAVPRAASDAAARRTAKAAGESPVLAAYDPKAPGSDAPGRVSTINPGPVTIRKKTPAPGAGPVRRLTPASAADDCAQLTEVDAQGIRRVKRQCLR